ncbi:MAG TPA: PSD1 and planctomycete cytochrome C domain-containing protein [Chthoniobacteraceae bacterium]|nr:PSD1 and planctomycete cytochrome C domain-containing protein [Chthoniobacteraceae bacterium]
MNFVPFRLFALVSLAASAGAAEVDFNRDIRPIFSENCYTCHGPDGDKRKAELRLDRKESAFGKAKSGETAVVPGDLAKSELIRRVTAPDKDDIMPPPKEHRQLKPAQIDLLKRWVQQGAPWTGHWAFEPVKQPAVPGGGNPIDAFVRARLAKEGLSPAPEEERARLIRRVSLDLTGLPPSIKETDEFLADTAPNAFEKVVDRLLASPACGERLAVPWLDLARYGDTSGYHNDSLREMWIWREWVVKAFNANMPFDQFTIEQLAGDLLPNATIPQQVASGFHRNVMTSDEGGLIDAEYLNLYIVDRVNTTGETWLGLTVRCAQCHDHKYDPITQRDFYQVYAFFNSIAENGKDGVRDHNPKPFLVIASPESTAALAKAKDDLAAATAARAEVEKKPDALQLAWEKELLAQLEQDPTSAAEPKVQEQLALLQIPAGKRTQVQSDVVKKFFREARKSELDAQKAELDALQAKVKTLTKAKDDAEKAIPSTMVMSELPTPRPAFIKVRGNYDQNGEPVVAAMPSVLPQVPPRADGKPLNRLDLAQWLVSQEHPLTSRVTVNRWWAMLFGTGIVKTVNDFGSQGEWPSHPELLDWLAADFKRDWDIKRCLKQMVMSATYRQSAKVSPELLARDSENRLLAHGPRQRLNAEFIRDNALAIGGILNPQLGGKSFKPAQPAGTWEINEMSGYSYQKSKGDELYRRGLYVYWRRSTVYPSFVTLDAPTREFCVAQRARTSTPLQSLVLMNDPVFVEAARAFAQRILAEGGADAASRLTFAWRAALSRPPAPQELAILDRTLQQQLATYKEDTGAAKKLVSVGDLPKPAGVDESELAAWMAVSNVLLNLNETITN